MKERFEGAANRARLIDALKRQEFVCGESAIAEAMADAGTIEEFHIGQKIVVQGDHDSDVYLLLAGSAMIVVNGFEHRLRSAGHHIGEMAAIEPSLPRSATAVVVETAVALKLSSAVFMTLGTQFPQIWLPIGRELARRLYQRNDTIPLPNTAPKLFIISSSEAKRIAYAIRTGLERDVFSTVWDDGVFFAGGYPLEALELQVAQSDFALAIAEPDDIVTSRGKISETLRDNVLFELGLFMGKLSRFRAILVHPRVKDLRIPSDLHGLTLISYEPGDDTTIDARLQDVCDKMRTLIKDRGVRTFTTT